MSHKNIYKSAEGERAILDFYENVLRQWPVPYEGLNLTTRFGNTFIIACGNRAAIPMVLLHGSSTNSAMWLADCVEYGKHFRVYAVDIPGEPGKSTQHRLSLQTDDHVYWLEDVFNQLDIEKAILAGISLGGYLALRFSVSMQTRVETLVLLCPGGVVPCRMSWTFRLILLSLLGSWGAEKIAQAIFRDVPIPPEVHEFNRLIMTHYNPRVESTPVLSDRELKELDIPALLLAGEKDIVFDTRRMTARLKKLLPQCTALLMPDAGHVLINTVGHVTEYLVTASSGDKEKKSRV